MAVLRTLAIAALVALVPAVIVLRFAAPVAAQNRADAPYMKIAENDVMFNRLLKQLASVQTAITSSASKRLPFNLPVGQVNDAAKVFMTNPWDPCLLAVGKGDAAISQTATSRIVIGQPGLRIFGCFVRIVAGAAEIPSWIEGTVTNCGTGTAAVSGSTTAANGESLAANGGFSSGNGAGTVLVTNKAGDDLCLQQSGSNRLAGNLVYTYAP